MRDLHDTIGPALAAIACRVEAIAVLLERDPPQVADVLTALRTAVRSAEAELRMLLDRTASDTDNDPMLALRAFVRHLGEDLTVELIDPDGVLLMPAIADAVYRIATEALANVIRHAGARRCTIRLVVTDSVELEVRDDGRGIVVPVNAGIGIASMAERAADVGGICGVEPVDCGGTRVLARLPTAVV